MELKNISLITPIRNNKKYFELNYNLIRKYFGYNNIEFCMLDDACNDGTFEFIDEIRKTDKNIKFIRNTSNERIGHTIGYDLLINIASNDIVCIWHCDMLPDIDIFANMLKHLNNEKIIVSATRIEPDDLHPNGPEKILTDQLGKDIGDFNEDNFLNFCSNIKQQNKDKFTNGVFAPWMCYKKTYQEIGGNDWCNFSKQSKEDSDIFNRLKLYGCNFIQSRDALCMHWTCKGSRRNPFLTTREQDSKEWVEQNVKSTKNFIRKWGSMVKHDQFLHPIISHKYNIGLVIKNKPVSFDRNKYMYIIREFEPFYDNIFIDDELFSEKHHYVAVEQKNTFYNLDEKIKFNSDKYANDIVVEFDCNDFDFHSKDQHLFLMNIPEIFAQNEINIGNFEYSIFKVDVRNIQTYEHENIIADNSKYKIDFSNLKEI